MPFKETSSNGVMQYKLVMETRKIIIKKHNFFMMPVEGNSY